MPAKRSERVKEKNESEVGDNPNRRKDYSWPQSDAHPGFRNVPAIHTIKYRTCINKVQKLYLL